MASWKQVRELFDEMADLAPEERAAALDRIAGGDTWLRAELQKLLNADGEAGSFMMVPVFQATPPTVTGTTAVFSPGEKVGDRFRIVRFLGEGGMGQVYQAEDEVLGGFVALKTIRPEIASQRTFERFKREVRLAKTVTHDNVCRVFDLDHDNVPPFVTMELVEGETLSERLRREGKIELAEAFLLFRQMAEGLDAAHQKGIIHRDFKPGNVMLTRTASGALCAKVTDFGLARHAEGDISMVPGKVLGTPGYMAPEQLECGQASVASDIYSLGLVMYEMVTGSKPEFQRLTEPAPSPRVKAPELPVRWEATILRCLERAPAKRFLKIMDAVTALREETHADPTTTSCEIIKGPTNRKVSRRKLAAVALLVVTLICVVALGVIASKPLNTSVTVFPITNLTNSGDYDYLCQGTTTELIRRLSQLDGIRVIRIYDPPARGQVRLAGAGFVLFGELQEFQKEIRLTMQLTDRTDGSVVWVQNFEQELKNPLELQSRIAQGAVEGLERHFFGAQAGDRTGLVSYHSLNYHLRRLLALQLPKAPTTSNAAMEAYMHGQHLFDERTIPAVRSAIDYYQQALKEDPKFALAYAGLAEAQFSLLEDHYAPPQVLLRQAREYAEQAVALGPDLAETYLILAEVRQQLWDWTGAERSFQHAIHLNPNLAVAHRRYGGMMAQFGRFDEAFREVQLALKLDPYNYPAQSAYGLYLFYARRYHDAVVQLERTLKEKDFIYAHVVLGHVYAKLGVVSSGSASSAYFEKAFREAGIVAELERSPLTQSAPGGIVSPFSDCMYALFNAMTGARAASLVGLHSLESNPDRASPVDLAQIYAALGERDKALDLLEQGAVYKDWLLLYLKVQPFFDSIRDSPRFRELLNRMAL